jgi:hypothetical protein
MGFFRKPKAPNIPSPPAPPEISSDSVQKEAEARAKESQQEFLKKKKRSKTLLTGPQGVEESGVRKTILG